MFLSVNIPVYNAEKYLRECIESVLCQSFSDFELILADDGSTDKSGAICDEYAARDSRIRVLHLENGGSMSARSHAFEESSGDYIFMMDADDVIYPDLFERMHSVCREHAPDILAFNFEIWEEGILIGKGENVDRGLYEGSALSKIRERLVYDKQRRSFNRGSMIYSLWSKFFRRDFLKAHFPEIPREIVKGEDMIVTALLVCAANSVYFMDFCGYKYRISDGSIMSSFKEGEIQNYKSAYSFLLSNVPAVPKNNIAVWMLYMFLEYCHSAARLAGSATEFEDLIGRNADEEFLEIVHSARLSRPKLRDIRHIRLIKNGNFKALYSALKKNE